MKDSQVKLVLLDHLRKTVDSPWRKKLLSQRLLMNHQLLHHYKDPTAVHSNEGGTLVSPSNDSVPVITEGYETAALPVEEPVTDTNPLPP